jgi:hypothetical protein
MTTCLRGFPRDHVRGDGCFGLAVHPSSMSKGVFVRLVLILLRFRSKAARGDGRGVESQGLFSLFVFVFSLTRAVVESWSIPSSRIPWKSLR